MASVAAAGPVPVSGDSVATGARASTPATTPANTDRTAGHGIGSTATPPDDTSTTGVRTGSGGSGVDTHRLDRDAEFAPATRAEGGSGLLTALAGRDDPTESGGASRLSDDFRVVAAVDRLASGPLAVDARRVAELRAVLTEARLTVALDTAREQATTPAGLSELTIGTSTAVPGSLSVGYVLLMLRGGVLLTGQQSSRPALQLPSVTRTPLQYSGSSRPSFRRACNSVAFSPRTNTSRMASATRSRSRGTTVSRAVSRIISASDQPSRLS